MRHIPPIKSVMTPFPHSVEVGTPLDEAREFMREHDIGHLPVTENHELIGVMTERNVTLVLGPNPDGSADRGRTVRDAYVPDTYVVDLNAPLDTVLLEMADRHVDAALVTRKGKLVGVFTVSDICRSYAHYLRDQFLPPDGNDAA